jgi:4-hydroxythreonine-4-phosphate dehydrogenase
MTTTRSRKSSKAKSSLVVVTTGCPAGIGPEVSLKAAFERSAGPVVLVGDRGSLVAAARVCRIDPARVERLPAYDAAKAVRLSVLEVGKHLSARDRAFGKPSRAAGAAQLAYVEAGYALAQKLGVPLVTGPVSKEAIAKSGLWRARSFRGHTEWLEELDAAPYSVMCFSSPVLTTSLVTTHLPLGRVPGVLSGALVSRAIVELSDLLLRQGVARPKVAVCAFNPHAGEGELLGNEERRAVLPGVERARKVVGRRVLVSGPIGAETAFRIAAGGAFDGVVGMYHDQVTIPMKLLDFGGSVNVTQGLSIVRTSVDHGTAYDIAGQGRADAGAMQAAMRLARRLADRARRFPQGAH